MKYLLALVCVMGSAVYAADTDKTLVAWVTIKDANVRGGSLIAIQSGDRFDGIVFAELSPGKWMAGSNFYRRTNRKQNDYPAEKVDGKTPVQMAIVYKGDRITIYRNGQQYASHKTKNIDLLSDKNNIAVFGLRHIGGTGSIAGTVDDARIYARALTVDEIKSLEPDKESTIKPCAWWDFEGEKVVDKVGRFPHSSLQGGAKVEKGRLVLVNGAVVVAAATKEGTKVAGRPPSRPRNTGPHVPHIPIDPEKPPTTWLTYHLTHPGPDRAIPADPNCAIFYKARYHMHYIYQHKGHSFAHLSSTDMVNWKRHFTVLTPPVTGHGMFSGTAFLTKEGKAAIIYHGQGSRRNQIALAMDDNLEKWTKTTPVEPKNADGSPAKMRHWDPDCWLRDGTYYALGGGGNPTIAKSKDLKEWEFMGELFHPDFPKDLGVKKDEDVSCANMFKIGDKWMLFCISHGLGSRYYLGDFKDGKYLPYHHAMFNWARWDYFAPETLLTPDGRRVAWAWCTPWINGMQKVGRRDKFDALMKGKIQAGIQSLPRELSLPEDGVLRIKPLRELEKLRYDQKQEKSIKIKGDSSYVLKEIAGDTIELEIVFTAPKVKEFGVKVLCAEDGSKGFTITSGKDSKTLTVEYIKPPFELKEGEDLTLRVFIDKSMIETFANDRQAAVTWHEYDPKDIHVALFSKGGDLEVKSVTAWKIKPIQYTRAAPYKDPIHFKPALPEKKTVGDVMPFFWKGEYHVFYLTNPMGNHDVNWEHCSSKDLVTWKEYPAALTVDKASPDGPEGGCMFTGCIVEKDGIFHAWYTSWNPRNPKGREFLSHATSKDLIKWTKHPEHMIAPDGKHYASHRMRDFRDPQIFWNDQKKEYWMHVLANVPGKKGLVFGLLTSKDLVKWEQKPPVLLQDATGDECPDYFKIGDTHYIHGCRKYYYSDKVEGPYKHPKLSHQLDFPSIRAAKRVWDGRRHVWFGGWFGHVMPLPRKIYAGPEGLLYMKPVEEIVAIYKNTALDLSGKPAKKAVYDVPDHYMLDGLVKFSAKSTFSILIGGQYLLSLNSGDGKVSLKGPGIRGNSSCPMDTAKSVKIQVFREGNAIECFINDRFAVSCVVRSSMNNRLEIDAEGGDVQIVRMKVKTSK